MGMKIKTLPENVIQQF